MGCCLERDNSRGFPVSDPQFHFAFHLPQRKTLGALGAQPEVFNCFVFCVLIGVKTKKSASVEAHQRFGALRIGTLRDHESVALLNVLDGI
jgi:hypothetical protein